MSSPKTVYDLRRENLKNRLEEPGAKTQLALKLGVSQARITHLVTGHRPVHEDTARQIEDALGLSPRELDRAPGAPPEGADVDMDLMVEATAVALEYMRTEGLPLDKAKAVKLTKAIYAYGKQAGGINAQAIRPLLKMLL